MGKLIFSIINGYVKSYRGLPLHIWIGLSAGFANALCGGITFLLSLYLVKNMGMSIAVTGTVISCFGVGTVLGAYIGGRLCDSMSSFYICIVSLILNSIALLVFPFLREYHEFLIVAFAIGFSNYAFIPAIRVWLMKHSDEKTRLRSVNLLRMVTNLGMGFSVWISTSLAVFGFKYAFYFCALMLILFSVVLYCYGNKELEYSDSITTKDASSARETARVNKYNIYCIYLCVFMMGLIFSQLKISYPLYLHSVYGLTTASFGRLFFINTLLVVLLQNYILDLLSDINQAILVGVGGFCVGLGMFLLPFGSGMIYAILLCLIWSFGEMLFFSVSQVMAFNQAKQKGKHMGAYQMVYASTHIIGPVSGGFLYHHFSGDVVWYICGLFGVACLIIGYRIYFHERSQ